MSVGGGFGGGGGVQATDSQGIFVSHATEDAPLAVYFSELIQDVSAGMIPTYASSSKDKNIGIPYGDDWFKWIQEKINQSSNVVALITPTSVGRPWILFEAGLGRATPGTKVFGLRLGTSGEEAYAGPFKAFQNSGSEPDDLLKLCLQLFEGTPCHPRDETVKLFVDQFLKKVLDFFAEAKSTPKQPNPESEAVFGALEEIKMMVQSVRVYSDDRDDHELMQVAEFAMNFPSKGWPPAMRVSLWAGIASEFGMRWVLPTVELAMREPLPIEPLEVLLMNSRQTVKRRFRKLPIPPDMILHSLLESIVEYQRTTFGFQEVAVVRRAKAAEE